MESPETLALQPAHELSAEELVSVLIYHLDNMMGMEISRNQFTQLWVAFDEARSDERLTFY